MDLDEPPTMYCFMLSLYDDKSRDHHLRCIHTQLLQNQEQIFPAKVGRVMYKLSAESKPPPASKMSAQTAKDGI